MGMAGRAKRVWRRFLPFSTLARTPGGSRGSRESTLAPVAALTPSLGHSQTFVRPPRLIRFSSSRHRISPPPPRSCFPSFFPLISRHRPWIKGDRHLHRSYRKVDPLASLLFLLPGPFFADSDDGSRRERRSTSDADGHPSISSIFSLSRLSDRSVDSLYSRKRHRPIRTFSILLDAETCPRPANLNSPLDIHSLRLISPYADSHDPP